MFDKLKSRKFWIAVAAFLASIGTSISGLVIGDANLTQTGAICCAISAGIYAAAEAYVDGQNAGSNTTSTVTTVSATTNSKETVEKLTSTATVTTE